jgi:hypothetical protein
VARINPSTQAGSRSILVYLAVEPTTVLRQGLFAEGMLGTGRLTTLTVPVSALRTDKPQPYVQVVENGKIAHRTVVLRRTRRCGRGRHGRRQWIARRRRRGDRGRRHPARGHGRPVHRGKTGHQRKLGTAWERATGDHADGTRRCGSHNQPHHGTLTPCGSPASA